jgi:hypothetical protein
VLQVDNRALSESERLKAEQLLNAAIKTRRDIETRNEMLESRIVVEHPKWRTILRGAPEVLRPFPAAAEAFAAFLAEVEEA